MFGSCSANKTIARSEPHSKTTLVDYFVAPDGVDAGKRGTKEAPWRTIAYALKHLKPGNTLYVRGGLYYERALGVHLSGTADKPIVIQGYPGENVVIDGGFPEFRDIGNKDWELFDPKINEWRSKAAVGLGSKGVRVYGFILGIPNYPNERVRLVTYEDPKHLRSTNEVHAADETDAKPIYVGPGVWRDPSSGRIHIRLVNNVTPIPSIRDPRKLSLHLATTQSILDLSGSSYLTLQHLTLQNARRAIRLFGVNHHIVFDGITTWATSGIFVPMSTNADKGPLENSFITVKQSRFYNDHPKWLYWSDMKRPPDPTKTIESGSIWLRSSSHDWEIAWNHFRGGFDGPAQDRDSYNIKYHHNLVEAFADDAFELQGNCVNVDVYENYIRNAFVGVAASPCLVGPVKVYRNVIANLDEYRFRRPNIKMYDTTRTNQIGYPFKFTEYAKTGVHPKITVYQNTIVFLGREGEKDRGLAWVNNQSPNGYRAFNNIGYVVNGAVAADYGATNLGQQIDGNLYFKANSTDGADLLHNIAGIHFRSLASFRASATFQASKTSYPAGWEVNGLEGNPLFSGFTPNWNQSSTYWIAYDPFFAWPIEAFSLQADSPARHAGVVLPEDLSDTRRSPSGVRPDIGAIPFGEKFQVGPDSLPTITRQLR
jgi:hypothetical protein